MTGTVSAGVPVTYKKRSWVSKGTKFTEVVLRPGDGEAGCLCWVTEETLKNRLLLEWGFVFPLGSQPRQEWFE